MTPDGISTEDWDEIHGHAVTVANAETDKASDAATRDLLVCLDRMEARYGELPSILATRADYVDDEQHQRVLLERAHDLATERGDATNALWTALDLVKLHLRARALEDAELWLSKARGHRDATADSSVWSYADLAESLARERQRGQSPSERPIHPLAEDRPVPRRDTREAENRWHETVLTVGFVVALNALEKLTSNRMLTFWGALTIAFAAYALTSRPRTRFVVFLLAALAGAGALAYGDLIGSGVMQTFARYVSQASGAGTPSAH